MVSRLPEHDDLLSFWDGRDLEALRTSYTGSDDTTFANLDLAFKALLNPKIEGLLDRDSIFINLLQFLVQIVDNKQDRLKIKPEQAFKLLATCETVLKRVRPSKEADQRLGKLRIGVKTAIHDLLPSPYARYASIPWNILDVLSAYFERRLSIVRKECQAPENEDLDVLQIFSPLMRQIFLYKPACWEDVFSGTFELYGYPEELQVKRSAARQTFANFVRGVDKVFCHMHNNRDPELSWCHWRGECIADLYSQLPAPEAGSNAQSFIPIKRAGVAATDPTS
ncbi:hypothetical protein FRC05_009842 [Tulasnella sp. 425]|nr:hypothetical protein FRC05_009842 [Tulasnella sp. 425]